MVNEWIRKLVDYGINHGLIEEEDRIYTTNQFLQKLALDSYEEPERLGVL